MPRIRRVGGLVSLRALAIGTLAVPAGLVIPASPAAAQLIPDTCALLGGVLDCAGESSGEIDLAGSLDPVVITLQDGFSSAYAITAATLAGADISIEAVGDTALETAGIALDLDSGGAIFAQVGNVSTVGDDAAAALLRAVDEVIFESDGLISTIGANSDAINIEGSAVTVDLGTVQTTGIGSNGAELVSLGGPITLTADVIETDGDLSGATILRGTGDIGLTASAIRTGGAEAAAIDISTDAGACVLLAAGSCDVTAVVDEVTTGGFGSIGALVSAVGDTDMNIGVLRTEGGEAAGLDLSADPEACLVLGAGACDTAFTVGELTTAGARSPGALVRAVGDIDADVGLLRTEGDEAVGLDLASDPAACAILGAGACDTSFSVGELTTGGDGATGVLVRSVGTTTGDIGLLRTSGDEAAGVDIAADPVTCVLIGAGACDVGFTAGDIATEGNGAAAVLIDTVGNVTTSLGLVSTSGDDSTGLGILLSPASCLALGPGSCAVAAEVGDVDTDGDNSPGVDIDGGDDPVDVDGGTIDTGGDDSPGVDVDAGGPITVDVGTVTTGGDNSPAIDVDGDDDPIRVEFDEIETAGDSSPGVVIDGEGDIDVVGGTVTTGGAGSDGILIDGGDGAVVADVGAIVTTGPGSDAIDVVTDSGDQTIIAGPVTVGGAGSDGIVATSLCGDIAITAREDVTVADGTAIRASSGCGVSVTTLPGAAVSGGDAGIDVTSGTGATIAIGDAVTGGSGPAIVAEGGSADIVIGSSGSVTGPVLLTGSDDSLTNDGIFAPTGDSDFGGGTDILVNRGEFRPAGTATIAGLESFVNEGLIDLSDGAADDVVTLGGDFTGGAGSILLVDVEASVDGTPADRMVIEGNAGGTTEIGLNLIGAPAVVNADGVTIVDVGSAGAGSFLLDRDYSLGFVSYSLRQTGGGDARLYALPNAYALEPLLLGQLAQGLWYQSADAWSQSAAQRRGGASGSGAGFWVQGYGGTEEAGGRRSLDVFGESRDSDLRFDTDRWGIQAGVDFLGSGDTSFGVTGGYESAKSEFATASRTRLSGWNVGGYFLYAPPAGFYAEVLAKVDFFEAEMDEGSLFQGVASDGTSYGLEGELGYRIATGGMNVDLNGALAWVRSDLDGFEATGIAFDYSDAESLRGRLGVRASGNGSGLTPFAEANLLHEFAGENDMRLVSGGFALPLVDAGRGTWGRAEAGVAGNFGGAGVSLSVWGELGDVEGYGLRAGLRF